MNKLLIGIVLGLTLGVISYFALAALMSFEVVSNDFARVTVKNESGQYARSIVVSTNGGTFEANGLRNGEEVRFIFENKGENTIRVIAKLDNDLELATEEVYFEIGYRATETIMESEIVTEDNW